MPANSLFMSPTAPFPDLATQPQILRPLEAGGYLGRILNTYLWHLRELDHAVVPRLSMAAYAELLVTDDANSTQHVAELGQLPAHLLVLGSSLGSLYECLTGAASLLEDFVEMGSDFQQFAASKRAEDAQWCGYTDPLDVSPDGNTIVLRHEPEALAPFELGNLLAPCFASPTNLGERIGSSGPEAYAYFNSILVNGLVFSPRNPPAPPTNLLTYPWSEEVPMPTAEEQEEEDEAADEWCLADKALPALEVLEHLSTILKRGQQAATLFHSLEAGDAKGFGQLSQLIQKIIAGSESA